MSTLFGMSNVFQLYNEYVNVPYSPLGNCRCHSVKNGKNPKDIAKRRAKNKNKKTHRR
jgi:hypothetical protein